MPSALMAIKIAALGNNANHKVIFLGTQNIVKKNPSN